MPNDDMNTMLQISNTEVSLADLANINTDEIAEKRYEAIPQGLFTWVVTETKLGVVDSAKDKKKMPAIRVECQMEAIHGLVETREDGGQSFLDDEAKKIELFRMNESAPHDWIGYFKAFAADAGYTGSGSLQELLQGFIGTRFIAPIKHVTNPNDADRPYVNLDRDKIQPIGGEEAA